MKQQLGGQSRTNMEAGHGGQLTNTALSTWLAADIFGSSDRDLCGFSMMTDRPNQSVDGKLKDTVLSVLSSG